MPSSSAIGPPSCRSRGNVSDASGAPFGAVTCRREIVYGQDWYAAPNGGHMAQSGSILGNSVLRKEDPGLLNGTNQYTGDMTYPNMAHVVFVRSNAAHARLSSIDTSEAAGMPGVIAVYTADELGLPDSVGFAGTPQHVRPPLARGKVRFVGDIVAAVIAEDRYLGQDAADTIVVDLDPLPVVIDLEESLGGGTLLYEDLGSNICFATALGADVDALEGADVVAEARILSQRLAGVPMEPNA